MTFADRLAQAVAHEAAVMKRIRAHGWTCDEFGQALFSPAVRAAMKRWPTLVRWSPDLIAVRPPRVGSGTGDSVRLIDAKFSTRCDTPNYDVELASLLAHQRWITAFDLGVWLVFHDFKACRVDDVLDSDRTRRGRTTGNGSGRPFLLIPRDEPYIMDIDTAFARRLGVSP